MGTCTSFDNSIITRQKNIIHYLNNFIHYDIAKIISEYDYYLEGKIYIVKGIDRHKQAIWNSNVLHDGRIITQSRGTIKIWRLENNINSQKKNNSNKISEQNPILNKLICDYTFDKCSDFSILPDGKIASLSDGSIIRIINPKTGKFENTYYCKLGPKIDFQTLHDGRIVWGFYDKLKIFNLQNSKCDCTFKDRSPPIRCFAILPDDRIISASSDKTLKIWNLQTQTCENTLIGHEQYTRCITVLSDGRVITGSDDHTLKIWNLKTNECERTFEGEYNQTNCIAELPDKRIISGSNDGTLCIWNIKTGNCDNTFKLYSPLLPQYSINCISVLNDGRVVIGSYDMAIYY